MTQETDRTDAKAEADLDLAFARVRKDALPIRPELMTAILRDASAAQSAAQTSPRRAAPPRRWRLREVWRGLGGWPAGATLASAAVLGVALGLFGPESVAGLGSALLSGSLSAADTADTGDAGAAFPGFDTLLTEG